MEKTATQLLLGKLISLLKEFMDLSSSHGPKGFYKIGSHLPAPLVTVWYFSLFFLSVSTPMLSYS